MEDVLGVDKAEGSGESNRGREADPVEKVSVDLRLCGAIGSPYTMKMRMYLRYRRIPFQFLMMGGPEEIGLADPAGPPAARRLLPKLVWPSGEAMNDSSFLIRRLETEYKGREAFPQNTSVRFLALLLEDFADEWVMKAMYHHRWVHNPEHASRHIVLDFAGHDSPSETIASASAEVRKRQVSRLPVVGSQGTNGQVIEDRFSKLIFLLAQHFEAGFSFILGSRPSSADFAILGQLHPMLALDPNTTSRFRKLPGADRVEAWYHWCLDLSGFSVLDNEKGWLSVTQNIPPTLFAIFKEAGSFYAPWIVGMARARAASLDQFDVTLDGGWVHWSEQVSKYTVKCLAWLREDFSKLSTAEAGWVSQQLAGTGCEILLSERLALARQRSHL
eukprot:TRINITY_DN63315_c0_g1_i1.p1 TRINITY_DN63315_c0_g1~~TRINITY_DN63315_c0_g1_i1.p1  ORF type:complete len:388 (+),score=53.93 TRINITY_DN63315_c0_g1_i1:55-1218(+)